ncbi:hypothetical protein OHD16_06810 [Sphingobacterium sp. ML3W]|uniref:hypothetical protein n=1 Tax=Sphingobacterium sp. ML3W TaxID=1538644 RepID=UPI00249B6557|nr:hypothetical protein [Sphingobacterium sp. ML3W]WFA79680.1 hypothetical protein OGI71_27050 [Sphingobacterium sp. ML3W]
MKTLKEIKDDVCIDYGYFNYQSAVEAFKNGTLKVVIFNSIVNEIGRSVGREALKNAAENVELKESIPHSAIYDTIDKESILSETNIPEL